MLMLALPPAGLSALLASGLPDPPAPHRRLRQEPLDTSAEGGGEV